MADSSQQTTLYGPADDKGTSRFQVLGDGRRMYPIYMSGSYYDIGWAAHKLSRGGTTMTNLIARGDSLHAVGRIGAVTGSDPGVLSLRLGTAGNTGSNALNTANTDVQYGSPFAVRRLDGGLHHGLMVNGEAFFQDTQPTVPQLGCASELFTIAGTINQVTVGSATVTGTATNFTTAAFPGATYGAYTPSLNLPRAGDIIRIVQGANNYYHRIVAIASATSITIFPKWGRNADNVTSNGATTAGPAAGLTYAISRTGYGSYSRIVSIYRDAAAPNDIFYNYYVGNHYSRALPGTIECFTREASGAAASSHFMCPQTSAAADIKAQDIAYYKGYLLYGYGGAIGWSVAGFPTSFTTGFGATDFPAGNVTVVANEDQFISFEMLGDQLLAIFRKSIWEVQATGTSPFEFEFYKLPEPVGAYLPHTTDPYTGYDGIRHGRPTVSGRNAVYYISHTGIMELSGRSAKKVSDNIEVVIGASFLTPLGITWSPALNAVMVVAPLSGSDQAYVYRPETQMWSWIQCQGINAGSGTYRYLGSTYEEGSGCDLVAYDDSAEVLKVIDSNSGGPFLPIASAFSSWVYKSPIIALGDDYGSYQFAGFQIDGVYSTITYTIYGGPNVNQVINTRDTGTVAAPTGNTNRQLSGKRLDDPFIQIQLSGTDHAALTTLNIYALGMGR